jgi:hypothetical protein
LVCVTGQTWCSWVKDDVTEANQLLLTSLTNMVESVDDLQKRLDDLASSITIPSGDVFSKV